MTKIAPADRNLWAAAKNLHPDNPGFAITAYNSFRKLAGMGLKHI